MDAKVLEALYNDAILFKLQCVSHLEILLKCGLGSSGLQVGLNKLPRVSNKLPLGGAGDAAQRM